MRYFFFLYDRYRTFWGLILGLHAFLAGRVWYVTFVPTWWDKESNTIMTAAGAVAALGYVLEGDNIGTKYNLFSLSYFRP